MFTYTESVYAKINQEYINAYGDGKQYTWETKRKVMGKKAPIANKIIMEAHGINQPLEHLVSYKSKKLEDGFSEIKAFPKALDVVKYFKEHGMKVAIATSSQRDVFNIKMRSNMDLMKYVDYVVCGDDPNVEHSKPEPDIFIYAAKLCGETDLTKAVIFEDAIYGVMAALATGGTCVAIPDQHIVEDEIFKKANVCLKSLADFQPSMIGLEGSI
ncbi:2-deoxyglucose-6-phosphate phosphatase [Entamoeba marina]